MHFSGHEDPFAWDYNLHKFLAPFYDKLSDRFPAQLIADECAPNIVNTFYAFMARLLYDVYRGARVLALGNLLPSGFVCSLILEGNGERNQVNRRLMIMGIIHISRPRTHSCLTQFTVFFSSSFLAVYWGYHRQGSCQAGLSAAINKVRAAWIEQFKDITKAMNHVRRIICKITTFRSRKRNMRKIATETVSRSSRLNFMLMRNCLRKADVH